MYVRVIGLCLYRCFFETPNVAGGLGMKETQKVIYLEIIDPINFGSDELVTIND